jgi:hypothetical protein
MTLNLKEINSKLKSERRAKQNVSRNQVECAKLTKQVSKLTAQIDRMASDLKEAKLATAKLLPAKKTLKSQQEIEKLYFEQEERKKNITKLVR